MNLRPNSYRPVLGPGKKQAQCLLSLLEQSAEQAAFSVAAIIIAAEQQDNDDDPDKASVAVVITAAFIKAPVFAVPQTFPFTAFSFIHKKNLHNTNYLIHTMQVLCFL